MSIDLITATSESFAPYVGQIFTVDSETGPVPLTLDNIKIFKASTVRDNDLTIDGVHYPARQAFALTFEGPREPVLANDVMQLRHEGLGSFALLLSPFRQDHDCMLYEVVFN
ncbi:hypothetical protein [Tateyamaria sp. ANG-S1]|uniref:DUF6916 family protein n=1 Tax=Tateyamaria sp. ANG-S1 TaxID=1577905 RepID=UPI00057D11E6|nr:hypothetical protein [Tateyamaria sp. ANG-S1]KIC47791.1 hypothetical protein RA29_18950 [Tateyamaria sp. ANG-S1]